MSYELIIFDVDGTLVTTKSGATFRKTADDWQWLPGRREKLQDLRASGVKLAVATNQGGVAFGYMQAQDVTSAIVHMAREASVSAVEICYTHPKARLEEYRMESDRRKPGPGMLQTLIHDAGVEPQNTLMVGDREEDRLAASVAGVDFQWADTFFDEGEV